jgi:uncharacterized protein (TIRG00374 family)
MVQSPNRSITRFLFLVFGAAALAVLCWRFGIADVLAAFGRVRPSYLLLYLALSMAVVAGHATRWRLVALALGSVPAFARLVGARLAGDAVGWLVPSGRMAGEPVRVALVYADGLEGSRASAGVALDRLIELMGNIVCAATYVSVFASTRVFGGSRSGPLTLVGVLVVLLAALSIPLAMLRTGRRPFAPLYERPISIPRLRQLIGALRDTEEHLLVFFRDHAQTFMVGLLLALCIEGLVIVQYEVLLASFGIELDLPTLLLALVASGMSRTIPAPAGLGALEASQVTVLAMASGRAAEGFVVGILMRFHETLWMAAGLTVCLARGISIAGRRWSQSEEKAA